MDSGHSLVLHFGMTGSLDYFRDKSRNPPHERLVVGFSNGYHLAYNSERKLGKVTLRDAIGVFVERRKLGTDALEIDLVSFKEILFVTRASVKSALMNKPLIDVIVNIYSDEILFQAGVHPQKEASRLNQNTLTVLFRSMQEALGTAIGCHADPERLLEDYLILHRRGDRICPRCRNGIKTAKISGHTTYFCPNCQD